MAHVFLMHMLIFDMLQAIKSNPCIKNVPQNLGKYNVKYPICVSRQVLESFKIMDYSLLLGVHNKTQAERERQSQGSPAGGGGGDERRRAAQRALYSTAMESIQGGSTCRDTLDHDDT